MEGQPLLCHNAYDQPCSTGLANDGACLALRSRSQPARNAALSTIVPFTYTRKDKKMSKDLSLTQRHDLEAVPFFDAHPALSYPLRIRYIVETHAAQQRMKRELLN